jgi:plasmid stabilization system protein ParE
MGEEKVMEVLWTDKAKASFNSIVNYLTNEWTDREVDDFIVRVDQLISRIQIYPQMCKSSLKRTNTRVGLITRHTQLIYHYKPRKNQIVILYFWGTPQNPKKLKY